MRVAIDFSPVIYPQFGVGTYLAELIKHLVSEFPQEEFVLLGYSLRARERLKKYAQELRSATVEPKIYPLPVSLFELIWNRLNWLPVERLVGRADLFHASDWVQPPTKMRLVTTVHDLAPWILPETFPKRILNNQKQRLELVKRNCRLVITDSKATKRDLVQILKFDSQKIRVVYLGVDHQRFRPDLSQAEIDRVLAKYGLTRPYLLTVGTRNPRKNLARVLQSFKQVLDRTRGRPKPSLVIAGRFGWGGEIKPRPGVHLTGFVAPKDLPALYAGAKAFIFPSLYEGFGLPVLEAMAVGTPAVTSRAGSLPEVAGEAAVYVDPKKVDQIAAGIEKILCLDPGEEKIWRERSLAQARRFSWPRCARETFAVYQEAMTG